MVQEGLIGVSHNRDSYPRRSDRKHRHLNGLIGLLEVLAALVTNTPARNFKVVAGKLYVREVYLPHTLCGKNTSNIDLVGCVRESDFCFISLGKLTCSSLKGRLGYHNSWVY